MSSAATRKLPNCFNFLRQLAIIQKSSGSELANFDVTWLIIANL